MSHQNEPLCTTIRQSCEVEPDRDTLRGRDPLRERLSAIRELVQELAFTIIHISTCSYFVLMTLEHDWQRYLAI